MYWEILGGRPSRTPCERLSARASRVRCEIKRRSNWVKVAEHVCDRLPVGRRRLSGAVEGGERPALLLRGRHQGGEIGQRLREPLQLQDDEPKRPWNASDPHVRTGIRPWDGGMQATYRSGSPPVPLQGRSKCRARAGVQLSVARAMAPGSGPAREIMVPSGIQIAERPAASSKPPPVEPAKLATATQT
jgi:hypothetical protein